MSLFQKRIRAAEQNRNRYVPKAVQIERTAAEMRAKNLNYGKGCKTRAKAIAART